MMRNVAVFENIQKTSLKSENLEKEKCSITYRITRHGCQIFLPLRETIEESAKRRRLWHY